MNPIQSDALIYFGATGDPATFQGAAQGAQKCKAAGALPVGPTGPVRRGGGAAGEGPQGDAAVGSGEHGVGTVPWLPP